MGAGPLGPYSAHLDEDVFPSDLQRVAIYAHGWIPYDLPRGHVVLPAVPRAGDDISFQEALPERPTTVQTGVVDGVKHPSHVGEGNRLALHLELPDRARGNFHGF